MPTVDRNFKSSTDPVAGNWRERGDTAVRTDHHDYEQWWSEFNDSSLNRLVDLAYQQYLTVLTAGTGVLEGRAELGAGIGEFYPQGIGANVTYD